MKKRLTALGIVLLLFFSSGSILTHCYAKKRTTSGRFYGTNASKYMWSYNKKTKTMTIKPVTSNKVKYSVIKDEYYWRDRTKKLVYKEGVPEEYIFFGTYDYSYNNSSLQSVAFAKSVEEIGDWTYNEATKLKNVTFKKGNKRIGRFAFANTAITQLIFPEGLKYIGMSAFESDLWGTIREIRFNKDLEYIGENAFSGAIVSSVNIPDSVSYIGAGAFFNCPALECVRLSNNLESIENKTFYNCSSLMMCSLSDSIITIKDEAFAYTDLDEITIPRNVEELGCQGDNKGIFNNCNNLKKIKIVSRKINCINQGAFSGIPKDTVIEVSKDCLDRYKDLLRESGVNEDIKIRVLDSDESLLKLNRDSIDMKLGVTRNLKLMYADNPDEIMWNSSDESVVTVDASGNATPVAVGEASIIATYKEKKYECTVNVGVNDANDDLGNLKKLIEMQKSYNPAATMTDDYNDRWQYTWENGRLVEINWSARGVYGTIDLNAFTHLRSFVCDEMNSYVVGIEADNLEHLTYIKCSTDVPDENIHVENAKNISIKKTEPIY